MDSVKVAIRIRPLISREYGSEILWTADTHQVKLKEGKSKPYVFDRVFDSDEMTSDVYNEIVQPIVKSAMTGFNGTVFAYGQTSSGKTYTMMGDKMNPGIIPLSVNETFHLIQKTPEREFLLRVLYMEIYNEIVRDLLSSSPESSMGLSIREDEFRNVVVHGLTEKLVVSPTDVLKLMEVGERRRQVGCTNMNERSSRSHTIFRMIIESRERVDPNHTRDSLETDTAVMVSQLNLVDLAGSERAGQTGAEGQRFKEGCHINKSLSTLGLVINQICKASESGQSTQFISYRDSKLTRILQPSLGGNSLTAILCAVTPASLEESDSTLRFASSAKKIKNKPHVNEVLSDEALLFRQKREINQLKKKISEMELHTKKQHTSELEEMLAEKNRLQKEQGEKIEMLKKIILVSTNPADAVKKQRTMRRETWCPGALGLANLNATSLSALDLDSTLSNKSLYLFERSDRSIVGTSLTQTVSPKKRIRFKDEWEEISSKKCRPTGSNEEEGTSVRFSLPEEETERWKLEELEDELEKYKALNNKHIREKEGLEHKIGLLLGKVESLDEMIEDQKIIEEEKEKLEAELKEHRISLTQYMIKEKEWQTSGSTDITDIKDQLQDTCHQNRILQEKTDSLQELIHQLELTLEEQSQEIDQSKKSTDSEIGNYKLQISTLQTQLKNPTAPNENLSVDQDRVQEFGCKSSELEDLKLMNDNLRMQLDQMKLLQATEETTQQEGNFTKEINELNKELSDLHREIICKDELIENLKKEQIQGTELNSSGVFGEKTMNDLIVTSENLLEERNDARKECEKMRSELDETKNLVVQLKQDISTLEENLEFINAERDMIYMQEKESAEKITALNKQLSQQESEIDRMQRNKQDLEGNSLNGDGSSEDQVAELQSLKEELCNALRSSEDAQSVVQDVQQKLAFVTDERNALKIKMEKTEKESMHLQSDIDSFSTLAEITKEKYEARIKEMAQQLQAVYDQVDGQAVASVIESTEHSTEDEKFVAKKEKAIYELQQQLKESGLRLQENDERVEEVNKLNMQLQEKISILESDLQAQNEKIPEHVEGMHADSNHSELAILMEEHNLNFETLKEKLVELEILAASKKELVCEMQSKEESIIELEKLLEQRSQDLKSFQSTDDMVDDLKRRLEEKDKELSDLCETTKNTSDLNDIEEMQRLVQAKDVELSELQGELQNASNLLQEREKSIEELKTSVNDLSGKKDLQNQSDSGFVSGEASERTLREELASTRKELAEMCIKYDHLSTETEHAQGALLAETNRELDQRRLLDIAKKERKESVAALVSERDSCNNQMSQLLNKVGELQSSLCFANCERDVISHQNNKLTEECEFLRQQVKELEKIHQNESSILPRNSTMDPEKMVCKIKQLSLNLELTKQTSEKLTGTNKKLQDENKRLEGEYIRAMNLKSEVTSLKSILEQERQSRTEEISRLKITVNEVNGMRSMILELQEDLRKRESSFNEQAKLASDQLEAALGNENNLRVELANVKQVLSVLEEKLQQEKEEGKDSLCRMEEEEKQIAELTGLLEDKENLLKEREEQLASLRDRLEHSFRRLEEDKEKMMELENSNSSLITELEKLQTELGETKRHAVEEANKHSLLEQSLEHVKKQLDLLKSDAIERQVFEEEQAKFQAQHEETDSYLIIQNLKLEVGELKESNTELKKYEASVLQDNEVVDRLKEEVQEKDRLITNMTESINKLQATVPDQTELLVSENTSVLSNEVVNLKQELVNKIAEVDKYRNEVDTLQPRISHLEDALSIAKDTNNYDRECSMEDDGIGFAASLDQEIIESLTEKVADFKLQLQEKEEQINDLMQEMEKLRNEKAPLIDRQLTENISEDEISNLVKAKTEAESKLLYMQSLEESDVIQMKNELLTLQKNLQREDARMAALTDAKRAVEAELQAVREEYEEQISQLHLELKNNRDQIAETLIDIGSLEAQEVDASNHSQILEEKHKPNDELEKSCQEFTVKQEKIDEFSERVESTEEEMEILSSNVDGCEASDQNGDIIVDREQEQSALRTSIENTTEELEQTKQEKEEYSQSLIKLEEENNSMKRTLQELENEKEQKLIDLEASLENISNEMEKLQQEKEECTHSLIRVEEEKNELKTTLQELENTKEQELLELRDSLENINQEMEKAKQELEEYSQSLIRVEEEKNELKITLQELENVKEQELLELRDSLENINKEMEKPKQELEEYSQSLMTVQGENNRLKTTLQELENAKEQDLLELRHSLENIKEEMEKAKQELEEYSQSLITVEEEKNKLKTTLQELENAKEQELLELRDSLGNIKEEMEKAKQETEEYSQAMIKLKEENNDMKNTASELENEKLLLEEKCNGFQQSLTMVEARVNELEASLTQSGAENIELQETVRKLNDFKNDLEQEIQKSQIDLDKIKTALKNSDIKEQSRKTEIHELEEELSIQKSKASDYEEKLNSVYDMISSKVTEMEESAASREKLEHDYEKLSQEYQEVRVSYEELRDGANISEDIKHCLEQAEKRNRELNEQVCEVTKSNDSLGHSLKNAEKYNSELDEKLLKLSDSSENFKNLLEKAESRNCSLNEEIFSLQESLKDVKDCLEMEKTQCTETTEELMKMKTSHQDLRKDYLDFLSHIQNLIGKEIIIEDLPVCEESKEMMLKRLEVVLGDLRKKISDYEEKISILEKERDDSDQSEKESKNQLEKYKQKCSDLEEKIEGWEKSRELDMKDKSKNMLVLKEELEALKTKLESVEADKQDFMTEIEKLKVESEQNDIKLQKLDSNEKELQDLKEKLSASEKESACSLDELKGILYKKELELQTLQSEAIKMSEHYEERKASWKEETETMKQEMLSQKVESQKRIQMLESNLKETLQPKEYDDQKNKLAETMQELNNEKAELERVNKILEEKNSTNSELSAQLEACEKEMKEVKEKLSKVSEKLHSRIDYLEQACFETEEELEAEKKKVKELESKLENSGKDNSDYPQKELDSIKAVCSATEKKYRDTKEKWQNIAEKLKAEQHKCSQLTASLKQATTEKKPKESKVDTSQLAKELYFERQNCRELKEKIGSLEKKHSGNMLETEERYRDRRRFLMSRITTMEQHCIDADEEVKQEKKITEEWKERVWELEKKVTQLEQSIHSADNNNKSLTLLAEDLKDKEKMIVDLKEKLALFISSQKGSRDSKEANGMEDSSSIDLKDSDIGKLQQQRPRKPYAGGSGGVVNDTKVYVLEMEILNLHKRIKFLEKELAKYKDVETKRRSENVELLEENKKLRTIVKKVRDSRSSTTKVLQEKQPNCNKANEENAWSFAMQEEIPPSTDTADANCKNQ